MVHRLIALAAVALSLSLVVASVLQAQEAEELPDPPEVELEGADEAEEEEAEDQEPRRAELNETVPDFTLPDQNEQEVTLSDYEGKIIVLEWVAWRCPYVVFHYRRQTQLNLIEQFDDADPEVVWIGINSSRWSTPEHNREAMANWDGVDYPVLSDASGEVGRMYNAQTTPHMMVICSDFKLRYTGAFDSDSNIRRDADEDEDVTNYVEEAVAALLDGEEVSRPETRPYGCRVQYARDGRRAE